MRYEYHYLVWTSDRLVEFLNENNIKYTNIDDSSVVFDIYSDDPKIDYYTLELNKMNATTYFQYVEFTTEELLEEDYLMISPRRQSIDIVNEDAFEYGCVWNPDSWGGFIKHEKQVKDLVVRKIPSMKRRTAFWSESTGFSIIFADKRIKDLVEANNIKGVEFRNVFLRNGNCCDDFFQMTTSHILKKECIVLGHGEKINRCPKCGKVEYNINARLWQLHLDFSKMDQSSDFYMTEAIFGGGIARPIYVISKKFYHMLVANKLDKNIEFRPVISDVQKWVLYE